MALLKRPSANEDDNDLMKADEEFIAKIQSEDKSDQQEKRKSKFAKARDAKRKKASIIDYTVLEEAVSNKEKKAAVMGRIVERDVSPQKIICKPSMSHGRAFPKAPTIPLIGKPGSTMNLYMQYIESQKDDKAQNANTDNSVTVKRDIISPDSHILSDMSHDEIMAERTKLLESMNTWDPSLSNAFQQYAKKRAQRAQSHVLNDSIMQDAHEVNNANIAQSKFPEEKQQDTVLNDSIMEDATEMDNVDSTDIISKLPEETQKYHGMSKIEVDKLKWMEKIHPLQPLKTGEKFVARFDFDGFLLPYDSDIPTDKGLHHHGEEPERAGYTTEELFRFVRMNVLQQRRIGLKILANILSNAKKGYFDQVFETSIIKHMVDADLGILLRYAIDESTALVYQEALRTLYHLICNEQDELCLDMCTGWVLDSKVPAVSSLTHSKDKDRVELESEEKELKDNEILELDIVRGLIKMNVHLRLRYFLSVIKPGAPEIVYILGILTRMARHSTPVAVTLAKTPGLLDSLFDQFVPDSVEGLFGNVSAPVTSLYGIPVHQAVKFFRVMCERSRDIAIRLMKIPKLTDRLIKYARVQPFETKIAHKEAFHLLLESYSLWSTLLLYRSDKSSEHRQAMWLISSEQQHAMLPLIVSQLILFKDKLDMGDKFELDQKKFIYDLGSRMASVLANYIEHLISDNDFQTYNDISALVTICLTKWFTQLSRNDVSSFNSLRMVGSFLNFFTIYLSFVNKVQEKKNSLMKKQVNAAIKRFLASTHFQSLIRKLKTCSNLCSSLSPGQDRDPPNLSSLGSVAMGQEVVNILHPSSPFPLLLPLSFYTAQNSSEFEVINDDIIFDYMSSIGSKLETNWFTRYEIFTLINFMKLSKPSVLIHATAIKLMSCTPLEDNLIPLLINIICQKDFWSEVNEIENKINDMEVSENVPLISTEQVSNIPLSTQIFSSLSSINDTYLQIFPLQPDFVMRDKKKVMIDQVTYLNGYWPLETLIAMKPITEDEPIFVEKVKRSCQLTYYLLQYRRNCLRDTEVNGWFRYLSLVFTIADDLFFDPEINAAVQGCLKECPKDSLNCELTVNESLPNMQSGFDWYTQLVNQYSSVSYGDPTFSLFVIIPLQMNWPDRYRGYFWHESNRAFSYIRLSVDQVCRYISLNSFIYPVETNETIINIYKNALKSEITPERNPFLHFVANSHVTKYFSKK